MGQNDDSVVVVQAVGAAGHVLGRQEAPGNRPIVLSLARPPREEELSSNVVLLGNGWWREEGRPEFQALTWTSDVQGELGRGQRVTARLAPGTHHITLHAGTGDRTGEASVTVHVEVADTSTTRPLKPVE